MWRSTTMSIKTKIQLFNTTCIKVFLYGGAFWVISRDTENKINSLATSYYRAMLNIKQNDHIPNATIYTMTNTKSLLQQVKSQQLKFLGHILRLQDGELTTTYALYVPMHGRRCPGRQCSSYLSYLQHLLELASVSLVRLWVCAWVY